MKRQATNRSLWMWNPQTGNYERFNQSSNHFQRGAKSEIGGSVGNSSSAQIPMTQRPTTSKPIQPVLPQVRPLNPVPPTTNLRRIEPSNPTTTTATTKTTTGGKPEYYPDEHPNYSYSLDELRQYPRDKNSLGLMGPGGLIPSQRRRFPQ